jgi:peroxiredoxin
MSKAQDRSSLKKKTSLRTWITYGSLALIVAAIIIAVAYTSRTVPISFPQPVHLDVGQKAPEFTAATTQGPFDLAKAEEEKAPVLLEIFATWCPHCQRETISINKLYDEYKGKLDIVAVSGNMTGMDGISPASQEDVVHFGEKFKVRYPLAYDPDLTVAHLYMQTGYPTLVLIGKDGKILFLSSGEIAEKKLRKVIDGAVKG